MAKNGNDARNEVRLDRIALDAGVSIATVSKVLNGRSDVAQSTRERVEALLAHQGYEPRAVRKRSKMIELVFHELDSAWAIEVIRGVERVVRQMDLSLILTESGDRHSPGTRWIAGVLERRPLGVILVFSDLTADEKAKLRTRDIPFVIVDPAGDPAPDVPAIGSANWAGGLSATRHLVSLGHRRIGMISGPDDIMCSRARVDGYRAALQEAGIPFDPALVREGDFHVEGGAAGARELLGLAEPPTAIFAGSDLQAMGVYEAARERGLTIPRDLSVVGYDDLQASAWLGPPLTTIRQPLAEMAEQATRLVVRLASGEKVDTVRLDLATSLVSRLSCAAPRS
ncbi:LacI family DNA-binding transcriptional regulator [Subtercola frigoramans]|uniref:LacI family xylobiose transport system transcriptional regulator n=1 Tax=Subtercola frigoramans TaxID=120298 RepID=A0ABS2L084_9MICO|nr:LacI family DNA-binding transcriptional regulator [Subtercola frigoramans]MBM7470472.1 LacI family xylobiose transport system transcriptional regulator [Subtercola frigoramans]